MIFRCRSALHLARCLQGLLRSGRQEIATRHHGLPGLAFQLIAGLASDPATCLGGSFVLRHAGGVYVFRNLPGGQFGQCRKNQFRFAHVVAQVMTFKALQVLVFIDADPGPFLVNDVGQDGELTALLDVMVAPVVGELVARFLPGHALLNPLVAAPMLLPGLTGSVQRQGRIGQLLHAFIADLGQPQLDGLGLGAGDGLDDAEQTFCSGAIGVALLAVRGR